MGGGEDGPSSILVASNSEKFHGEKDWRENLGGGEMGEALLVVLAIHNKNSERFHLSRKKKFHI